jgi:glycosyltransferase involved in cell wall biosynthesis
VSASSNKCNAATNRNRGWGVCTGDWVVFLDSDDLYHPMKLEITDLVISDCPSANLVVHSYLYLHEASPSWYTTGFSEVECLGPEDIRSNTFPENEYIEITHVESGNTNLRLSSKTARVHHGVSTVRRNVSVRFPEHFAIGEDGYFCRKVCWEYSGVVFANLGLMIYRN